MSRADIRSLNSPSSPLLVTNQVGARQAIFVVPSEKGGREEEGRRSVQGDEDAAFVHAHRMRGDRVLGRFQAFAGRQVEVVLVERRGDDDAITQAADQAAREHAGAGLGVDVVDGVDAGLRSGGTVIGFMLHANLIAWTRFGVLSLKELTCFYRSGSLDVEAVDAYLEQEIRRLTSIR